MTLLLTSSPQYTNQLVLPASAAGSHERVSGCPCLDVEQSESVVEETTGLIIGHVHRTHANNTQTSAFLSLPRSYKHVNENNAALLLFHFLVRSLHSITHHYVHAACVGEQDMPPSCRLVGPSRDTGWICRQGALHDDYHVWQGTACVRKDGKVMDNLSVGVRTNKNNLRQCSHFNKQRRMLIKGKEKNAKKNILGSLVS